jgi:hypothetical protein
MKNSIKKYALVSVLSILAMTGCKKSSGKDSTSNAVPLGVHFKIAGKQYDVTVVRGIYDPASNTFAIYNNVLPGSPDTTLTLAIGSNFTGSTGTFKSDDNDKGFVFGFVLFDGSLTKPIVGYGAGQNDSNSGETVANTPISITLTSFSFSGSPGALYGNVTAQGTFSGTAYDIKNNTFVVLSDGTFSIHP